MCFLIVQDSLGIEKLLKVYKDKYELFKYLDKIHKKVRNVFYELFLYQMFFSRTAEPLEIMKMINQL